MAAEISSRCRWCVHRVAVISRRADVQHGAEHHMSFGSSLRILHPYAVLQSYPTRMIPNRALKGFVPRQVVQPDMDNRSYVAFTLVL